MARNVEGRVRRLDEWADARYSIVPPDAARDKTLSEPELRVLLMLGSVNTEKGWCEASQTGLAETLGYSRQTVSEAANALVRRRYLDVMRQTKSRAFCLYRVLVDDPLIDAEAEDAARDEAAAGVSSVADTGPVSSNDDTVVGELGDAGVVAGTTPEREITDQRSLPPKSPDGGLSGKSGNKQWRDCALAELRTSGRNADAVENLIAPLLASDKRLSLGRDALAALRELAEAAAGIAPPALGAAAKRLVVHKHKLTPLVIRKEIDVARGAGAMVVIRRGTPEWQRWAEHLAEHNPQRARVMAKTDVWQESSQWPPAKSGRAAA